jgi:xanthine/uracil permease
MKEFSVPMALVDYIPVVLFFLAAELIYRDIYRSGRNKVLGYLFIAGAVMVSCAGFLKASYKLLYALNIGDFLWMSRQFFSNQAFGFLIAGVALAATVIGSRSRVAEALPTMALVGVMVVGLAAMDASLCYLANSRKKRSALICIIVSFFLSLAMGYLSSKNFDKAFMNWVAQGINTAGQLLLYIGARILHKA